MATPDMPSRLKSLLPPSWFGDGAAPVRDAVLAALGAPVSWGYGLYQFVLAQARLATSSGIFVDLFALDFFGKGLPRRTGETDDSYKPRIAAELIRPRNTRAAMTQALTDLTGTAPTLFEPWNTGDAAALNATCALNVGPPLGSLVLTDQVFISAKSPGYIGAPNVAGIGSTVAGLNDGYMALVTSRSAGGVTNAEIYATVLRNIAAGVRAWVKIS